LPAKLECRRSPAETQSEAEIGRETHLSTGASRLEKSIVIINRARLLRTKFELFVLSNTPHAAAASQL